LTTILDLLPLFQLKFWQVVLEEGNVFLIKQLIRAVIYYILACLPVALMVLITFPYIIEIVVLIVWLILGWLTVRDFGWKGLAYGLVLISPLILLMILVIATSFN
jgi:hypothetical protein